MPSYTPKYTHPANSKRLGNILAIDVARTAQLKPTEHAIPALQACYEHLETNRDPQESIENSPKVARDPETGAWIIPIKLDTRWTIDIKVLWYKRVRAKWYCWMLECLKCGAPQRELGWYGQDVVCCWKCAGEQPVRKVYIPKILEPVKRACAVEKAQQARRRAGRIVNAAARRRFRLGETVELGEAKAQVIGNIEHVELLPASGRNHPEIPDS